MPVTNVKISETSALFRYVPIGKWIYRLVCSNKNEKIKAKIM
jgi:hypothetical protein